MKLQVYAAIVVGVAVLMSGCGETTLGPISTDVEDVSIVPSLPERPRDRATGVGKQVTLQWRAAMVEEVAYTVLVDTALPPAAVEAENIDDTALTVDGLPRASTYFWRIVAKSEDRVDSSDIWSFSTGFADEIVTPMPYSISAFASENNGRIWLAVEFGGLISVDAGSREWDIADPVARIRTVRDSLYFFSGEDYWAINEGGNSLKKGVALDDALKGDIYDFAYDAVGNPWFITEKGVGRRKDTTWLVWANSDVGSELSATSIAVESSANQNAELAGVWIGLDAGFARLNAGETDTSWEITALPAEVTCAVVHGGSVWMGCENGDLVEIDPANGEHTIHVTNATTEIRGITPGADQTLWLGTVGNGFVRYRDGKPKVFATANSSIPGDYIASIDIGPDGSVWVASNKGIIAFQE